MWIMKNLKFILIGLLLVSMLFNGYLIYQKIRSDKKLAEVKKYLLDLGRLAKIDNYGSTHIHADIKIYLDGKELNLYKPANFEKNQFVHFHETKDKTKPNDNVIHIHTKGITLKHFFSSLGLELTENCLIYDSKKYCNDNQKTLKVYVNGKKINNFSAYEIKDLDKILVSYDSENQEEIKKQIESVGDNAKFHSTKFNFECGENC
jgi:hypothetical protein